jgi:hypothetical protein
LLGLFGGTAGATTTDALLAAASFPADFSPFENLVRLFFIDFRLTILGAKD